jgi:hypothetical protein
MSAIGHKKSQTGTFPEGRVGGFMSEYLQGDRMIWLVVVLLFLVSMLAVYSSTGTLAYKMQVGNERYLMKQIAMACAGLLLMFVTHLIDYKYYSRIAFKRCKPVDNAACSGFNLSNFRFGQACAHYVFSAPAIHKTRPDY